MNKTLSVAMIGATGAVGGHCVSKLLSSPGLGRLTTLGRRRINDVSDPRLDQHVVDVFDAETYRDRLTGHDAAICTFGVGQPSKVDRAEFVRTDKRTVLDYAKACRAAGVRHFELLASVGIDSKSSSFYLRTKGELVDALKALDFERLSIFQPSMILTPANRYGFGQAMLLAFWPHLDPLLSGGWRKYRGVRMDRLGAAMANNLFGARRNGLEILEWDEIMKLSASPDPG